jgi:tripeptidyl-peptidase-1
VHEPKTRPFAEPVNRGNLSSCDIAITPKCIQALYQIPPANSSQDGNSMGLFEEGDYYAGEDLDLFFKNMSPNIPQGTRPILNAVESGDSPVSKANAGIESDLDMQLAYPIIYPQTLTLYQTDDYSYATGKKNSNGFLNTFLDAIDGV